MSMVKYSKHNEKLEWHNLFGPAVEYANGDQYYYIKNKWYPNFIKYIQGVIRYKRKNEINE